MPRNPNRDKIVQSNSFKAWAKERVKHDPVPDDIFRAFMIDRSLRAERNSGKWKQEPNRYDVVFDHPAFNIVSHPKKQQRPKRTARRQTPRPSTVPKREPVEKPKREVMTKTEIRDFVKEQTAKHGLPMPKISFYKRRSSAMSSGAYTDYKGQVHIDESRTTLYIGANQKGFTKEVTKATILHEIGHLKDAYEKKDNPKEFNKMYSRRGSAVLKRERSATKFAREVMAKENMKGRAVGSWRLKSAFMSYQFHHSPKKIPKYSAMKTEQLDKKYGKGQWRFG